MLELIQKIKTYTEAGVILEHMELFDEYFNATCENCFYYEYGFARNSQRCGNDNMYVLGDAFTCYPGFCCNEWEERR